MLTLKELQAPGEARDAIADAESTMGHTIEAVSYIAQPESGESCADGKPG